MTDVTPPLLPEVQLPLIDRPGRGRAERQTPALKRDRAARRPANRGQLPAHLPRIEVEVVPESTTCPCCRAAMVVIGEDRSERLD